MGKLPIIMQNEHSECGLVCLAMISCFYGRTIDMRWMREHFNTSAKGQTLEDLIRMAAHLELAGRPVKANNNQIKLLKKPCIIHWSFNHFVVLHKIRGKKVEIHDPATGKRTITIDNFQKSFTGIALELTPRDNFQPESVTKKISLGFLFRKAVGLKRSAGLVISISIFLQALSLLSPLYIKFVVDDAIVFSDSDLLSAIALGFFLILLLEIFSSSLRDSVLLNLSSQLYEQLIGNLFSHLIRLPIGYFQKRNLGDILSRFYSVDSIRQALTSGAITVLLDGAMATIVLIAMFIYLPNLATVVFISAIIYLLIQAAAYNPVKQLTQRYVLTEADTQSFFMETVRAAHVIKIYQLENNRELRWKRLFSQLINADMARTYWSIGSQNGGKLVTGIEHILVIFLGAKMVISGNATIGTLFAFLAYKLRFNQSFSSVILEVFRLRILSVHLERLSDIVLSKIESRFSNINDHGCDEEIVSLTVEKLGFRFSILDDFIFKDISFEVRQGEAVAIIGPSGSGKTTLLKCLIGLLQPSEGNIYINQMKMNNISHHTYKISTVLQDDQLLSGSIGENINGFNEEYSMDRIIDCAKNACIHDEIMKFPMAYRTHIGDMGHNLSEGQKQRILLARAIYRRPELLFMDEATSNLDVETEIKINKNLADSGITRIFVAHRPDTIRSADRTISLASETI